MYLQTFPQCLNRSRVAVYKKTKMGRFLARLIFIAACTTLVQTENCTEYQWECDNGQCILDWWLCDDLVDCEDGSDEPGNIEDCPACEDGEFQCNSGYCIPGIWKCDGFDDCKDGTDEPEDPDQCPACLNGQFRCNTGQCLEPDEVCDGVSDCKDGSDERNDQTGECPTCPELTYTCATGRCIYKNSVCDRENDCGDWSDETEETCPCADNDIRCYKPPTEEPDLPGACIPPTWICDEDGIWDCPDGFDEANCTTTL